MRKIMLVVALGLLTLGVGACGSSDQGTEETTEVPTESSPAPSETASEDPESVGEDETATDPDTPAFEGPLVEQQREETAAKAGLIQSTKPEERLLQLKGSNNGNGTGTTAAPAGVPNQSVSDPFGVLPPQIVQRTPDPEEAAESLSLTARELPSLPEVPIAAVPPQWTVAAIPTETGNGVQPLGRTTAGQTTQPTSPRPGQTTQPRPGQTTQQVPSLPNQSPQQVPSLPELPVAARPPQAPGRPSPGTPPRPPQIPNLTVAQVPSLPELPASEPLPQWRDPNPPPPPPPTPIAILPPPPNIDIAKAISVSGVMQVGDETRVILKAPTEPTSRYVSVGQTIANGQVLVKRVKFNVGSEPIVIFEQNGVEVAVEVGTLETTDDSLNLLQPSSPTMNSMTPS